jgi:hypothetical protein
MTEIGPVQVLAIGFGPDARFEGRVLEELGHLDGLGTIRVLDLLFVRKDPETGDLLALDVQGENLGAIAGALLGFDFEPDGDRAPVPPPQAAQGVFGLSKEDLEAMAASLPPGQALGVLLIEHVWARDLKRSIRDAGGVPLAEGFLTPELMAEVAAELIAVSAVIEEEQAAAGSAA